MGLYFVPERAFVDVGPGEVSEVEIPGTEERELKAVLAFRGVREMPGVVPPLDGFLGVRAVVARKGEVALSCGSGGKSEKSGEEEWNH
jgi:hypothetical protein